jgi:hypothetical protein
MNMSLTADMKEKVVESIIEDVYAPKVKALALKLKGTADAIYDAMIPAKSVKAIEALGASGIQIAKQTGLRYGHLSSFVPYGGCNLGFYGSLISGTVLDQRNYLDIDFKKPRPAMGYFDLANRHYEFSLTDKNSHVHNLSKLASDKAKLEAAIEAPKAILSELNKVLAEALDAKPPMLAVLKPVRNMKQLEKVSPDLFEEFMKRLDVPKQLPAIVSVEFGGSMLSLVQAARYVREHKRQPVAA